MAELPGSLRSLLEVGLSLTRRTASGRVGLARYAQVVDDAAVPEAIRAEVRAELDGAWAAVVEPFAVKAPKGIKIDDEPLAITPTAQVYAGDLDGDRVAVKFARPGVAATIRSELALLDTLAGPLRMVFSALDVRGVMAEIRETTMDELDLEHEADIQHQVRRALRRVDGVTVPAVHVDECTPTLLVTELLDGKPLVEAADPLRVAELLVTAHLVAWRDAGLVLTDARPAHVLVRDAGIGLLGAGLARPLSRDRADAFLTAFQAVADDDAAAFDAAVEQLELLPAGSGAHTLLRELLGDIVTGEATLDAAAIEQVTVRAYDRLRDLLALGAQVTPEPGDIAAARMLGQLSATLARLEVKTDWPALVARAASA